MRDRWLGVVASLLLMASLACLRSAGGAAIASGDKLRVLDGGAPVKLGKETLTTVDAGAELTAQSVKGDWVQVTVSKEGRKLTGWIHKKHLGPAVAEEPKPAPAQPQPTPPPEPPKPKTGSARLTGRSAPTLSPPAGLGGMSFTHPQAQALVVANTKFPLTIWVESADRKKAEETSLELSQADWEALSAALERAESRTMLVTAQMAFVQFGRVSVPKDPGVKCLSDALKLMELALPATLGLTVNTENRTCLICRPPGSCSYFFEASKNPQGPAKTP